MHCVRCVSRLLLFFLGGGVTTCRPFHRRVAVIVATLVKYRCEEVSNGGRDCNAGGGGGDDDSSGGGITMMVVVVVGLCDGDSLGGVIMPLVVMVAEVVFLLRFDSVVV